MSPETALRRCTRCVMDATDPLIEFDDHGVCGYCRTYDRNLALHVHSGEEGRRRLAALVEDVKRRGAGRRYDCVIGLSGGVDSSYTALTVKRLGLRPLAVHLDNGWDSETAVSNIHRIVEALHIDLHTHVIDWEEFRDLQLAFLKASTPDSEIPTDHAIVALMYRTAWRIGVGYVITGYNYRTESHLSPAWSQGHYDWRYIKGIHRRFGGVPLRTFPRLSWWAYRKSLRSLVTVDVLDYVDYVKRDAKATLERELGWRDYGSKHFESIYTRFYQGYILPRKFGYDKRKTHLSSLVCAGEIGRDEALAQLEGEPYPPQAQREDRAYVVKKLCLSEEEFEQIMRLPKRSYWDYPSYGRMYRNPMVKRAQAFYHSLGRR